MIIIADRPDFLRAKIMKNWLTVKSGDVHVSYFAFHMLTHMIEVISDTEMQFPQEISPDLKNGIQCVLVVKTLLKIPGSEKDSR